MNDLTIQDQDKISEDLVNLVLQQVYIRIAPQLSQEDMTKIDELSRSGDDGSAVRNYLLAKVPDFDQIFQEEAELLKNQLTSQ